MSMPKLTRRSALFAAAAAPFVPAMLAKPAFAAAEMKGSAMATFNRFKLGAFEVTTLLAGTRATEKPQETFGTNASPDDFAALSAANFIPADRAQNFFTPTLVNTGTELCCSTPTCRRRHHRRSGCGGLYPRSDRCGGADPHARRSHRRPCQ